MADIPQWRRRNPPSRSRTPMLDLPDPDQDTRPSSVMTSRLSTPKKGLRPKLSSYLLQPGPFASSTKPEPEPEALFSEYREQRFPSWVLEDPYPAPSPDRLTHAIMCRLMSHPYDALEPRFNSTLLQILEAYRNLVDEKGQLQEKLDEELRGRLAERSAMQATERKWEQERKTYKADIKRLELIIAKGKRGVAEVALARQDSLVRRRKQMGSPEDDCGEDDGKETVFEFLEKTKRFEDPSWSSQRATMKNRPASPSAKMAKLSKKLTKKTSKTSIHADIPFGSPPPNLPSTSFLQASYLEKTSLIEKTRAEKQQQQSAVNARVSFSDDTTSTFSSAGDFLPDEASDKGLRISSEQVGSAGDSDMAEIRRMAVNLSRQRGVSTESIIPRLLELFHRPTPMEVRPVQPQENSQLQRVVTAPVAKAPHTAPIRRPSHIMGFFNKLKPQPNLESTPENKRFSFEVGDDTGLIVTASPKMFTRESALRKSASLSSLPVGAPYGTAATASGDLSPIESSPTTSARTTSSRMTTKIPSPAYNAPFAKQRQEREDSTTSLLTVTKHADRPATPAHQVRSATSSVYSTRSLHSTAPADGATVSRVAPVQVFPRTTSRLDPEGTHSSAGLSSNDAAGTIHWSLVDQTNAVHASKFRVKGSSSVGGGGTVDVSNVPSLEVICPMRGIPSDRPRAKVQPSITALENTRPLAHLGFRDEGKEWQ